MSEMKPADYATLGFMCGLEVHQQLATRGKLFCRCPAGRHTERVDATVLRHMRPTLSELGEYDGCALMEFRTRKDIVYLLDRGTVCTYEIDDTPPFPIDEQAVRYALEVSTLYGLSRITELQVMRKQYLDGSIPAGFQRTAMVALGGSIPFRDSELGSDRQLRIRQLTLEEDSCREVSDVGHRIVFRTDRLGTPLIETVTEPDLLTPRDVQTGGRLLARVVHRSGKVRRGAGAARQDVNVSIAGSRRVEIKGVSHHRRLPLLVHNEAFRHLNLLRIRAELLERGVTPEMFEVPDVDPAWAGPAVINAGALIAPGAPVQILEALERGHVAVAVRLRGFAGVLARSTQPGKTLRDEFADRLRVVACLTGRPFMTTSDDRDEMLSSTVFATLRRELGADAEDAIVVVWGPPVDATTAAEEILTRAYDAMIGVPSETRQSFADGTTGFERVLPGPERMYPDTDTPPLPLPDAWIEAIDRTIAEPVWDREDRYQQGGLSRRAAFVMADAPWADLYDALAAQKEVTRRRLASALECRLVHHWREMGARTMPDVARLQPLVAAVDSGALRPEAFDAVFDTLLQEAAAPEAVLARWTTVGDDVAAAVSKVVESQPEYPPADREAQLRWAMGPAMRPLLGRFDPAQVQRELAAALQPMTNEVTP